MSQSLWFQLRDEVKLSHNCPDFLNSIGTRVPHPGSAIICPPFIRPGSDSPSFTVYDSVCIDWVTGEKYDIISLCALALFDGDLTKALEHLAGRKLPHKAAEAHSQLFTSQSQALADRFDFYHQELLKNPSVSPNGETLPILTYLDRRGFNLDMVKALKLGYSPKLQKLIIPFFNRFHQPCYYSGRDMSGLAGKKDSSGHLVPKYWYVKLDDDRFSEILDKCIFGIDSIKPGFVVPDQVFDEELAQVVKLSSHHIKYDYLAVCEGMFDVLSFRAQGWAAVSGKLSKAQEKDFIDICRAYKDKGQKIFICFDSDKAGSNYQKNIALLLFRNGIPFVAGHLPEKFTVTRPGRPDFGQEIKIKDVSDYYAAGGSLDDLVRSAKDGMYEIALISKDNDELQQRFAEGARSCERWQLKKLKNFAISIMDDGEVEEVEDSEGHIIRQTTKKRRFVPDEVGFMYSEAMKPLQDYDIAKFVQERHDLIYDTLGQFYEYRTGVWAAMNDLMIQQAVIRAMNDHISANKLASVCKYLKASLAANVQFNTKHNMVFQNGTLWLDEEAEKIETVTRYVERKDENGNPIWETFQKEDGVMSRRKLYDEITETVKTLITDPKTGMPVNFRASTPDDMSTIQLSYSYDPHAHNEALERAARQWTNHPDGTPDEGKYRLLKQMFGYILFVKNTLQKFFILKGDGANGKSTCMHCIEAILGRENTTSLQLSRLSSEFDPIVLKHSRVNLCYDAQSSIEAAQETLKALIGGDSITAAHKGVDAESFTTNAKFIVSANKFFSASDVSQGLLRRMLFIAFNNTFEPKAGEDSIEDEIMKDLPGLFNFAYEGYKDLKASGYFVETDEQKALLEEFKEQLSPIILFAREELYTMSDNELGDKAIYALYKEWCKFNGEKALGRTKFIPEIRQVIRIDGVIPEPKRDPETKQWIFTFPYKPEAEEEDREGVSALADRQKVQEVSTSYEEQKSTQSEESAPVHSVEVYGEQAEPQEQYSRAQEAQSRESSSALQKVDWREEQRRKEKAKAARMAQDEADAKYAKWQCQHYNPDTKVPVPDRQDDDHINVGECLFKWLKRAGRQWKNLLRGSFPYYGRGEDEPCLTVPILNIHLEDLGVFLKKHMDLKAFLPGIDDILDFGGAC